MELRAAIGAGIVGNDRKGAHGPGGILNFEKKTSLFAFPSVRVVDRRFES